MSADLTPHAITNDVLLHNEHSTLAGRRDFLASIASAAFLAAHHACLTQECLAKFQPEQEKDAKTMSAKGRILSLNLKTTTPLPEMKRFYNGTLGLPVVSEETGESPAGQRLTIQAGETRLTFQHSDSAAGHPFYHFAFNIPENKILAAHRWQRERTELLPIPPRLRDPAFPDEVVNYSHWNAHSVFFFDPAGNVVEYIARHVLKNTGRGDFTTEDILYASEIAFVVDDVADCTRQIQEISGFEPYRGSGAEFAALGDELGLLLVMKRGRMISFDSPKKKAVSVFSTEVAVRGARPTKIGIHEFPYQIEVQD